MLAHSAGTSVEMSSVHTVLVFALVAAASVTPVYALESCRSTDRDCHGHDTKMSPDAIRTRWNVNASNLMQDLEQLSVSCTKLIGKTGFIMSLQ